MIRNKKGEITFETIIVVAILLITLIVIVVWAGGGFKKLFGGVDEKIGGLQDCDDDKTTDLYDKCPCDSSVQDNWPPDRQESKECHPKCTEEIKNNLCPPK